MMNLQKIIQIIETNFPLNLQEEWDCSGLQIDQVKEIKKIIVCLDINSNVVDHAFNNKVDLIISHHPLIFRNYYESYDYIRELYQKLYAKGISIYSMHTNYDNHHQGMNVSFVEKLGYQIVSIDDMLVTFKADNKLIEQIKQVTHDSIRVYNDKNNYQNVSILLGAGGDTINRIQDYQANTLISSEFKHHEILYAYENDLTLIDVNHQAELIFVDKISEFLNESLEKIKIIEIREKYELVNY